MTRLQAQNLLKKPFYHEMIAWAFFSDHFIPCTLYFDFLSFFQIVEEALLPRYDYMSTSPHHPLPLCTTSRKTRSEKERKIERKKERKKERRKERKNEKENANERNIYIKKERKKEKENEREKERERENEIEQDTAEDRAKETT